MVAFPLVVKVVAKPLLRLLRRKPPTPPPGPPKPTKTKQKTKQKNKNTLFRSDPAMNEPRGRPPEPGAGLAGWLACLAQGPS